MNPRLAIIAGGWLEFFGAAISARAAEASSELSKLKRLSLNELLQIEIPTVYDASKREQKTSEAPSSVTIVTREEIQAFGHRTLADILRSVRHFFTSPTTATTATWACADSTVPGTSAAASSPSSTACASTIPSTTARAACMISPSTWI